jgi:retron-type reverse transcriptase
VRSVEAACREGYTQAVDCDQKSCFDTVNPSRLLRLLAQRVTDRRVLRLISRYLRAGVQMDQWIRRRVRMCFWLEQQGVPNLRRRWIDLHYGRQNPNWDPASVHLTGIA